MLGKLVYISSAVTITCKYILFNKNHPPSTKWSKMERIRVIIQLSIASALSTIFSALQRDAFLCSSLLEIRKCVDFNPKSFIEPSKHQQNQSIRFIVWLQISSDYDMYWQYRIRFWGRRCDINPIISPDVWANISDIPDMDGQYWWYL